MAPEEARCPLIRREGYDRTRHKPLTEHSKTNSLVTTCWLGQLNAPVSLEVSHEFDVDGGRGSGRPALAQIRI